MARLSNNSPHLEHFARTWRGMIAAGVTSLAITCGQVKPAFGDWWKVVPSTKPVRQANKTADKSSTADGGFATTIRRLMAESRRAADHGDFAKAERDAKMAAKISEAAAPTLGLTPDCLPEKTSQLLSEIRSKVDNSLREIAVQPPAVRIEVANSADSLDAQFSTSEWAEEILPPVEVAPTKARRVSAPSTGVRLASYDSSWPKELPPIETTGLMESYRPIKSSKSPRGGTTQSVAVQERKPEESSSNSPFVSAPFGRETEDLTFEDAVPEFSIDFPREVNFGNRRAAENAEPTLINRAAVRSKSESDKRKIAATPASSANSLLGSIFIQTVLAIFVCITAGLIVRHIRLRI